MSVSGSIGWREVFGHTRAGQAEFGHWKDFYQLGDKNVQSIVTTDKEDHRRQRRLMSHGFSHAAIKEQEPLVDKYVQKLFAQFRKDAELHQPTDMLKWYNLTTLDIIGDLVFGESFNCLDNGESELVDSIFNTIRIMSRVHAVLRMPLLSWARRLMISKKDALRHIEQKRVSKDKAERRIALGPAPEGRRDIMTNILRHNDEKGMSHAEILSNADGLIMAGSETTATALAGLTYCITTNPQALERVQREVREAFNSEKDIKINSTMSLKYLNACIEEAMRIYPPVAETPTRLSPGEFVNNHYIPKGVSCTFQVQIQTDQALKRARIRPISRFTSGQTTTMPPTSLYQRTLDPSDGSVPTTPFMTPNSTRTRKRHLNPSPLARETALARILHMPNFVLSWLNFSGTLTFCCCPKAMTGQEPKGHLRLGRRFH